MASFVLSMALCVSVAMACSSAASRKRRSPNEGPTTALLITDIPAHPALIEEHKNLTLGWEKQLKKHIFEQADEWNIPEVYRAVKVAAVERNKKLAVLIDLLAGYNIDCDNLLVFMKCVLQSMKRSNRFVKEIELKCGDETPAMITLEKADAEPNCFAPKQEGTI
uniref:Uncharacterized protein n=2 Tax=Plectus sambesii TaxID=2011161 RepID=A0A914V5A5_9BILA